MGVGDTIYDGDEMRQWLEAQAQHYVLAVPCTHRIWTVGRQGEVPVLADNVPEGAWARVSAGEGSHGPRWYDWPCFCTAQRGNSGQGTLVARAPPIRRSAPTTGCMHR